MRLTLSVRVCNSRIPPSPRARDSDMRGRFCTDAIACPARLRLRNHPFRGLGQARRRAPSAFPLSVRPAIASDGAPRDPEQLEGPMRTLRIGLIDRQRFRRSGRRRPAPAIDPDEARTENRRFVLINADSTAGNEVGGTCEAAIFFSGGWGPSGLVYVLRVRMFTDRR